jgi:hypothetical protein
MAAQASARLQLCVSMCGGLAEHSEMPPFGSPDGKVESIVRETEIRVRSWRFGLVVYSESPDGIESKIGPPLARTFRIDEAHDKFRVKLKTEDTGYRVNPWVHDSRLKPRAIFPKRPTVEIEMEDEDDFDAALLPEDSWEPDSGRDEYEVEEILDLRWSKRTRTSRRRREYLVEWKGYDDPEWLPVSQLSCGPLLYEFNQGARARARFQSMQAGDDHPRA